jgi:hypothetical protein
MAALLCIIIDSIIRHREKAGAAQGIETLIDPVCMKQGKRKVVTRRASDGVGFV